MQAIKLCAELKPGDRARVVGFGELSDGYRKKLLNLGLTPGTLIELIRVAPLSDPLEFKVRGFRLSLRRAEVGSLQVEVL